MFDPSPEPRVFGVPPGADFPRVLAQGLRDRLQGHPPDAMARVEVLVNTARMQARLRDAMIEHGPGFLPRIRLISDLAEGATAPLRARLELAQLIRQLLHSQPDLGPTSAAFSLAESLFSLLDEMQGEGVPLDRLDTLDVSQHSQHWDRSLRFIRLIARFLGPASGPQARLRAAVQRLLAQWDQAPPAHPLIVAGSTGSRGPTALLMHAVARLPQGALVLPGHDVTMPDKVWETLDNPLTAEDHPQFRYVRFRPVRPWATERVAGSARNALISLALRPAPVTDQWLQDGPGLGVLDHATAGLTLIEARTPRHEALAIALCLRDAAVSGKKAALITPDRALARRVTAALDRWHIRPDDSAGRPLSLSAPGRFLRQTAALLGGNASAEALIALLKHPIAHSAADRGTHLRHTRDLELHLRRNTIPYPDAAALSAWAARTEDRAPWSDWLISLIQSLPGEGERPLSDWVGAHQILASGLAAGVTGTGTGELWTEAAGIEARALFDDLAAESDLSGTMLSFDYSALLETLFVGREVRESRESDPRVMIWGTLEARAQGADLVVLGGLTEGTWPAAPRPDPWFNRRMRLEAGLLLPERQIGLSAHDFQQAAGAPEVVLSRATRDAEAETVPSRWLNRLLNLIGGLPAQGGDVALQAMRERGRQWLDLAMTLESDLRQVPAACAQRNPRPAPAPPASARLNTLPVTRFETLIRDPFAIYAERILKLGPLDPLAPQADARLRGTVLHRIPDAYLKLHPPGTPGSIETFFAVAETILTEECPWQATRLHWLARLNRVAGAFVAWNAGLDGTPVLTEEKGALVLAEPPFTLTGQPDRIDRAPDGRLRLYDYKTGTPPSAKQQEHFNKQLVFLSLMAEAGAFKGVAPEAVESAAFIGLGTSFKQVPADVAPEKLDDHRRRLIGLIDRYRDPGQGFTALRAVELERHHGDFDALSRRGEWLPGDAAETVQVGDADG
ncbi:MAG: double-strand break repair protein AddB [Rhodobacter sp.]|uniref:double-strand break repair protein AddB n=1 Tax=Pararhodobacter sp. TaxID=2127056 RepID=UPI001E11C611|nr:double-strand break repair protein AddB [Pararhodobacter sp.]MCB1346365.1 double-strand break repair protein AddB [Paracoccaceae bacterium]MCC0072328.1 double-strand break repair protein AddB [Rhodobacter sp.]HPD91504.1 double-strand break repair protein AddB [Pararhodobacter sp.]